ncbi:MAG: hypothetical protein NVS4B8_24890 [Herpetosiphon sp.]
MNQQTLTFGPINLHAEDPVPVPYLLSGTKMYVLGTTDGSLQPIGAEHLVGEMGGIWAQPVKWADGWYPVVYQEDTAYPLQSCHHFEGRLSDATLHFRHQDLAIARTDIVMEDQPAITALLRIANHGTTTWHGSLGLVLRINIMPGWFSGWQRGQTVLDQTDSSIVAYDTLHRDHWGLAYGSTPTPDHCITGHDGNKQTAELRFDVTLTPNEERTYECILTADHQNGSTGALALLKQLVGQSTDLLTAKRARYYEIAWGGVQLETPDQQTNHEYALAKINLHMLHADYAPYLPGYFLGGVPEYPQLFGCDTTYSTVGTVVAGWQNTMKSALSLLAARARMACGRIPHEVTTNGRTFNPGNTQETPQFAIAIWDYVRWTGDTAFLEEMYTICHEGVIDLVAALWNSPYDGYPTGDAMVERTGMGTLKLDSACYLYAARQALANMASLLNRPEAASLHARTSGWLERFEQDWWLEDKQLYADSLHSDLQPQFDGHWTQVVPVQLGIAAPERATLVLDEIHRSFVSTHGLMHTRGVDERVWTLPTALLALADMRYGRCEEAVEQLHNIARTTRHGMLGAFEELIPSGLCFMQLWSSALYIQCIVEGILGLTPRAYCDELDICPTLPADWPSVTLRNLQVGDHTISVTATRQDCQIVHITGTRPLHIAYVTRGTYFAVMTAQAGILPQGSAKTTSTGSRIVFDLPAGGEITITCEPRTPSDVRVAAEQQ